MPKLIYGRLMLTLIVFSDATEYFNSSDGMAKSQL